MNMRELICKIFGHSFDLVELTVAYIKRDAVNAHELKPEVFCKRCKYMNELKFKCYKDGREQSYAPAGVSGGITIDEAKSVGWVQVSDEWKWLCPFCSGNQDKLFEVFED